MFMVIKEVKSPEPSVYASMPMSEYRQVAWMNSVKIVHNDKGRRSDKITGSRVRLIVLY